MRKVLLLPLFCLYSCSTIIPQKKISIGIDPTFIQSPVGHKSALVNAFTNELLELIFKNTRFEITYQALSFDNMILGLEDQSSDLIISSMDMGFLEKKDFSFSNVFLPLGDLFVTRKNMQATTFADFSGKVIALPTGSNLLSLFAPYCTVKINYYDQIPQVLENLVSGRVDGAMIPALSLSASLAEEYRLLLKVSKNEYSNKGLRLISLKDAHSSVIKTFNKRLSTLQDDGTLHKLLQKWSLNLQ